MERWELGLKWLGEDLHKWLSGEKKQTSVETHTVDERPVFQNIINNYSQPIRSTKFGFISMFKIVVLVTVIVLTIKLLMNPEFIVDSGTWVRNFFLSI